MWSRKRADCRPGRFRFQAVTPTCSGLQTVARGLAHERYFRLTFGANKNRLEPTITANELTLDSWSVLILMAKSFSRLVVGVTGGNVG